MLVVTGIPLFFLESAFGQFCSQGPINIWRSVPILQGKTTVRVKDQSGESECKDVKHEEFYEANGQLWTIICLLFLMTLDLRGVFGCLVLSRKPFKVN